MLIILLFAVGCFAALLVWWARSIPIAYAWYPNSHDKMLCYALDMLAQMQPPTLFGWLLKQSRKAPPGSFYRRCLELQARRGSIEEDMNSHLFKTDWDITLGANGGYHYFNPYTNTGLSDGPWPVKVAGWAGGCPNPMPSAFERATCLPPGLDDSWQIDHEQRNYTVADAINYYELGHTHLAFYAIGRIVHLLEDMAVPAHTRNDCHSGIGSNPEDALEVYADNHDGALKQYDFQPNRSYPSDSEEGKPIFLGAIREWNAHSRGPWTKSKTEEMMRELASWSHANFYSYGTIPGNGNSHDPIDDSVRPMLRNGKPIDWSKCAVAVKSIWARIQSLALGAYPVQEDPPSYIGEVRVQIGRLRRHCQRQADLSDLVGALDSLKAIHAVLAQIETKTSIQGLEAFLGEYDQARIPFFAEVASSSPNTDEAMKRWVEQHPDEPNLARLFSDSPGPFMLSEAILKGQWIRTQSRATAYVAMLLSNWFEYLYRPESGRGLAVWLNRDEAQTEFPDLVVAERYSPNVQFSADVKATIGIANHLPVAIPLKVEIELVREGTDEEIWRNGLDLDVKCVHVVAGAKSFKDPGELGAGVTRTVSGNKPLYEPLQIDAAEPYNFDLLLRPVPQGEDRTGGIFRWAESELPKLSPLPRGLPGQEGSDLFTGLLLRIEPKLKVRASTAPPAEDGSSS